MGGDIKVKGSDTVEHTITSDTIGTNQTQVVKMQLGNIGEDGGLVHGNNPLPTQDKNITDLYNIMAFFLDRLEFGMLTDSAKRLRVVVDNTVPTTVNTVTTVGTVNNQARIGDVQAQRVVEAQMDTAFHTGLMNHITF